MDLNKDRKFGIAATLLFHVLLVCLLWLLVMAAPPVQDESGVAVVLGNAENANGSELAMTDVEIIPQPEASQPESSVEPTPDEPLITQDSEESIAVPMKEKGKSAAELEAERKAAEAAERKRLEKETKAKADNLIAGAFGKGSAMGNKGNSAGDGTQGSKDGNSDNGKTTGVGGTGTFDLGGRSLGPAGLPKPEYNVQEEGRVVVTITVSPQGNVVSTSINHRTNTASPALRKAAEEAAKKATFNAVPGLDNQEGTITYYFKLK